MIAADIVSIFYFKDERGAWVTVLFRRKGETETHSHTFKSNADLSVIWELFVDGFIDWGYNKDFKG
jgi:hypothetical protein